MDLLAGGSADYVLTGSWSRGLQRPSASGSVRVPAGRTEADQLSPMPAGCRFQFDDRAALRPFL